VAVFSATLHSTVDTVRAHYLALDELSELVAVLPNVEWRSMLLTEIALRMDRFESHNKKQHSQPQPPKSRPCWRVERQRHWRVAMTVDGVPNPSRGGCIEKKCQQG
jgi:hypothetical protein